MFSVRSVLPAVAAAVILSLAPAAATAAPASPSFGSTGVKLKKVKPTTDPVVTAPVAPTDPVSAETVPPAISLPAGAIVVAPWGRAGAAGTLADPISSVTAGLTAVKPGGTLVIRDGVYRERIMNPRIARGTAAAPVAVMAYPGERPVVEGLLWLTNADYWRVTGLTVRWSTQNTSTEHMVKMISGRGWTLEGNTFEGAHSFANLLVAGLAYDWTVRGNTIRDTYASNGVNQDHLMYVNSRGTNGVIEGNVLTGSPNGQAIKVGPPNAADGEVTGVLKIRYNTMADNKGPSNVQLSHRTSNVEIYRNVMVRPGSNRPAVFSWDLTGTNNTVHHNVFWEATTAVQPGIAGLADTGGNLRSDPALVQGFGVTALPAR